MTDKIKPVGVIELVHVDASCYGRNGAEVPEPTLHVDLPVGALLYDESAIEQARQEGIVTGMGNLDALAVKLSSENADLRRQLAAAEKENRELRYNAMCALEKYELEHDKKVAAFVFGKGETIEERKENV